MDIRPLSPELEELARRELNEDPARREQDLQHIRDWLAKQPHLTARTDSQWLITFLRGCKFSLERTKEKLDMHYTLKTAVPEFFSNRDPMRPEIQEILKLGFLLPMPEPDKQGRRVILMRNGLYNPDKVKVTDIFKVNMMIIDVLLKEDERSIICGTVMILDHSKNTLAHMTHFTPSLVKRGTTVFQEGYPARPKAMHHVHMNPALTTIFNLFKSFMKEKLKKKGTMELKKNAKPLKLETLNLIYLHAGTETLYEQIPQSVLPEEYGGSAGSIDKIAENWKKKLEGYRSWFLEDEKYKSDEKKRPGKPKTQEDLFGLEGSFRQLNVD